MVRTIIFCSRKCRVMLDRLRAPYPWLVLENTKHFVNGEPQWDEVMFRLEGLEWTWREDRERLLLEGGLSPILIIGIGWSLALRVHLLYIIIMFEREVDGALHSLLQLNEGWAMDRTSLIWVTPCFSRCLYGGEKPVACWWTWVQRHFHHSWESWQAGSESSRCKTWGCHFVSFWHRGGGGYSSWPPDRRGIRWGTPRLSLWNCVASRK